MNQQLLDILNNSKYKHKFPPRDQAFQIKIREGVSPNSRGAVNVTKFYIESASAVLEDFAETILRNRKTANITSESEVCQVFLEAFNIVSTEARSCALGEFNDGSFERWILEERGGSGCLDSFCPFISGIWLYAPTRRWAAKAGSPSTRDRACVRQARDAA